MLHVTTWAGHATLCPYDLAEYIPSRGQNAYLNGTSANSTQQLKCSQPGLLPAASRHATCPRHDTSAAYPQLKLSFDLPQGYHNNCLLVLGKGYLGIIKGS